MNAYAGGRRIIQKFVDHKTLFKDLLKIINNFLYNLHNFGIIFIQT